MSEPLGRANQPAQTVTATVAGVEVPTGHLIGGERVDGGDRIEVSSPIDGTVLGSVPGGGAAEVDAAVAAARSAFPAWAALGPAGRGERLDALAARILERTDELAAVETADNGSLLIGNQRRVVARAAQNISFFAAWARTLRPEPIVGEAHNSVHFDPAGVAALIVPWNAPLMLGTWKIGPALAAGDTVVIKPPEWAPFSLSLLGQMALDVGIPPGVLNVVHGVGESAGAALVAHPGVDRISFTGSVPTARLIAAAAAPNLTPVSFELGGKSPLLVMEDADLDAAARTVAAQFVNAGQVCLAGTRLLVHRDVLDELMERVVALAPGDTVGDPRERSTRIGPLIHPDHAARVDGFVERALAAGAKPVLGGGPHPFGPLYYSPTILTDVAQDSEIVQEEVFGPVLTLQSFASDAEAVELANGTRFGLAGTLYSTVEAHAARLTDAIVAGTLWVNCFFVRDLAAPFGGAKESGMGREGGTWSFDFFCDVKNVAVRPGSFVS